MNCYNCGAEVASGTESCANCGARLELECPACRHPYIAGNRFCGNCGLNLVDAAAATAPPSTLPVAGEPAAPQEPGHGAAPESTATSEPSLAPQSQDVVCSRCHRPNDADSAYCLACGFPLLVSGSGQSEQARLAAFELGSPGGFWLRAVAYIIDTVVIVFPVVFLWIIFGQPVPESFDQLLDPPAGYDRMQILVLFLTMAYDTALITYFATTVGKRALGMYVVRSDGSSVGFVRALARHLLTAVSANLTLGLIFLVVLFREDRRGLHDLICDTVVIRRYRRQAGPHPDVR